MVSQRRKNKKNIKKRQNKYGQSMQWRIFLKYEEKSETWSVKEERFKNMKKKKKAKQFSSK